MDYRFFKDMASKVFINARKLYPRLTPVSKSRMKKWQRITKSA